MDRSENQPDLAVTAANPAAAGPGQRSPQWHSPVAYVCEALDHRSSGKEFETEVLCVLMQTSDFIGPRVFKYSVNSQDSLERIVKRLTLEKQRMLQREGGLGTTVKIG